MASAPAHAKFKVIYSFCSQGAQSCTDGAYTQNGLVADPSGNLYGVTPAGGANGNGTIYELVKSRKGYNYHLLYTPAACDPNAGNCPDGANPQGRLVIDTAGNLYGIMESYGPRNDGDANSSGVLFKVMPGAQNPYQVLHVFCRNNDQYCSDGAVPLSGLTYVGAQSGAFYDGTSALYGTTSTQGAYAGGTTYSYTPGPGLQTLHSFCYVDKHHFVCTGRFDTKPCGRGERFRQSVRRQ